MSAAKGAKSTKARSSSAKSGSATRPKKGAASSARGAKGRAPQPPPSTAGREILGLFTLALALVIFFSLGSHSPQDGANWIGLVGRWTAEFLYFLAGVGAWAIGLIVVFLGLRFLVPDRVKIRVGIALGVLLAIASLLTFLEVVTPSEFQPWGAPIGGFIGASLGGLVVGVLGKIGAVILLLVLLLASMTVITRASIVVLTTRVVEGVRETTSRLSLGARIVGLFVGIGAGLRVALSSLAGIFKRRPRLEDEHDDDDLEDEFDDDEDFEDEHDEDDFHGMLPDDDDEPFGVETASSVLRRQEIAVVPIAAKEPPAAVKSRADAFDPAPVESARKGSEFDPAPLASVAMKVADPAEASAAMKAPAPQILDERQAFESPVNSTIPLQTADVVAQVEEPPPAPKDAAQIAIENARRALDERRQARGGQGLSAALPDRVTSSTQERVRERMFNPIANPMSTTTRANSPVDVASMPPIGGPTPGSSALGGAAVITPAAPGRSIEPEVAPIATPADAFTNAGTAARVAPVAAPSSPEIAPEADSPSDLVGAVSADDFAAPANAGIRPAVSRRIELGDDDERFRTRPGADALDDEDDEDDNDVMASLPEISRAPETDFEDGDSQTAPHRIEWPASQSFSSPNGRSENDRATRPVDPVDVDEDDFELSDEEVARAVQPTGPQIIESEAQKNRPTSESFASALKVLEEQRARQPWRFPPIDFFRYEEPDVEVDEEKLRDLAFQLVEALSDYKVRGKVTGICPGPVVTRFEFEPEPGTKLSKISGLATDIAMRLRAENVRIIAPIPGKGCVGVEIPNDTRETVYLKEILADRRFTTAKSKLTMALGKDIEGFPIVADLAKMPHLLVAGTTGSGKSVSVNAMITSVLCNASPDDVRLILIDPKQLEFALYEDVPHLLLPVVTDPMKAATALQWAVQEMERRYRLMRELKVRNIEGYNEKMEQLQDEVRGAARGHGHASSFAKNILSQEDDDGRPTHRHMPFIIVVVDEFADLMMAAGKDVEVAVARIAQKARAAGIHCILATQRPSVDVLTGTIKSNFPTRMSFRLMTGTDSRTVIDTQGAEALLGMGDMLYRPPGSSDLVRVHGAFVDEIEIERVVEFLKDQREVDYDESILSGDMSSGDDDEDERLDAKYEEALDVCIDAGFASISMIQRRLGIGYNRAANIVEEMERRGVVGPSSGGASRREVLIRR